MNRQTPVASEAVLARGTKKAKLKGAQSWAVREPLEHLGSADQATARAHLFELGHLGAKHQVGVDAMADALRFMMMKSDDALLRGLTDAATKVLASLKTAPPDATSIRIVVVPVDVPEGCFDEPGEVRDAIGRLGGYAQGAPLWIQHDQPPKKRKKAAGFLFQINQALAGAHLNLGEGALFVFDDGTVVLQCD